MTAVRRTAAWLAFACGMALVTPTALAQDGDGGDGGGGPDLGFAAQGWFHLAISGTADYRVDGEPTAQDESIDNALGFGLLAELRIAKFFGVGGTFQWFQKQHDDDATGERWSAWDLDVHVRLRVPLFFLNLYVRVPFGLSVASLPEGTLVGRTIDGEAITQSASADATGWNVATLFGIELSILPILGLYFEIGPTWRHLPFEVDTNVRRIDLEVRTRDLTMNFGATLEF